MEHLRDLAEKVRHVATERGLTSCMNDTKWREVCRSFMAWAPPPRFRMRDLLGLPNYVTPWEREWYHHPYPYLSIHWLEVELPPEDLQRGLALCKRVGAAVEVVNCGLRIWGWVGAGDRPAFA